MVEIIKEVGGKWVYWTEGYDGSLLVGWQLVMMENRKREESLDW
jgi:hypothetical protein